MGIANNKKSGLLRSSLVMAGATFSSRVLGLVREQAMAHIFGASGITDAFLIAYRIPNMLRDLFAEGAFSSAFVPVFTEVKEKSKNEARRLLWSLFILLFCTTSVIALGMIYFAPELVAGIAPKFLEDTEKFELAVGLLKLMAPFLVLVSMAALFMGALNSFKVFFIPSLAPALFNVAMISCIFLLPSYLEKYGQHSIYALGIGVLIGGLCQWLVQFPLILREGIGPIGGLKLFSAGTLKVVNRLGIGTVGIAATQINILLTTWLATGTVVGAVSWLSYSFRLFQFPVGVLGVSLANSNLVHFSESWKKGERALAIETLKTSYQFSWILMLPASVMIYHLAIPAVDLVFYRGAFGVMDVTMSAKALQFYVLGLPFYGLYKILAPSFYTLDRPAIPVYISLFCIAINLSFCLYLTPLYGFGVLALGTTLSMFINSSLQMVMMKKILELELSFFIGPRLLKVGVAALLCHFVMKWSVERFYTIDALFLEKVLFFGSSSLLGVTTYLTSLFIMGERIPSKTK